MMDPIWLAMVLGAQASLRPPAYVSVHSGSIPPEKAYHRLKQVIRDKSNIDVDILDIGTWIPRTSPDSGRRAAAEQPFRRCRGAPTSSSRSGICIAPVTPHNFSSQIQ